MNRFSFSLKPYLVVLALLGVLATNGACSDEGNKQSPSIRAVFGCTPMYPDVNAFGSYPTAVMRGNRGNEVLMTGGSFWDPYWRYYLDTKTPPYVDTKEFDIRMERYEQFIKKSSALGLNAVILGDLLHITTLDNLVPGDKYAVFPKDNPLRIRHDIYLGYYKKMIDIAHKHGMKFFMFTDEFSYCPEIKQWIEAGGETISNDSPRTWQVYRARYRELFDKLPDCDGVCLRVGELTSYDAYNGKSIINKYGQEPEKLRNLIKETYDIVVGERGKGYIHRIWSMGDGGIHSQPSLFISAFDGIPVHNMYVSVKHTRNDFLYYSPQNPNLQVGDHHMMLELQAKPEYDGNGIIPCLKYRDVKKALQTVAKRGPINVQVWPAEGGPDGSEGQQSWECVPFFGNFRYWNEANVVAYAAMAQDPDCDIVKVLAGWADENFGKGTGINIAKMLLESDKAVQETLYTRVYAIENRAYPQGDWWFDLSAKCMAPLKKPMDRAQAKELYNEFGKGPRITKNMIKLVRNVRGKFTDPKLYDRVMVSLNHLDVLSDMMAAWRRSILDAYAIKNGSPDPQLKKRLTMNFADLKRLTDEYDAKYKAWRTDQIRGSFNEIGEIISSANR